VSVASEAGSIISTALGLPSMLSRRPLHKAMAPSSDRTLRPPIPFTLNRENGPTQSSPLRRLLPAKLPTAWLEGVGHPDEFGVGSRAHFVHGRTSMNFDRDFADPKVAGDLLIHFSGRDE
jgi:hypothetical protein